MDTFGKKIVLDRVESELVANVSEIGTLGLDMVNDVESLLDREMRHVRLMAQSIDNKQLTSFKKTKCRIGHRTCICDIGPIANSIAKDRHLTMDDTKRLNVNAFDREGVFGNNIDIHLRNAWILILGKDIRKHPLDSIGM